MSLPGWHCPCVLSHATAAEPDAVRGTAQGAHARSAPFRSVHLSLTDFNLYPGPAIKQGREYNSTLNSVTPSSKSLKLTVVLGTRNAPVGHLSSVLQGHSVHLSITALTTGLVSVCGPTSPPRRQALRGRGRVPGSSSVPGTCTVRPPT